MNRRRLFWLVLLLAVLVAAFAWTMTGCHPFSIAPPIPRGSIPPPDTTDPFWMVPWVGGFALLVGAAAFIASFVPAAAPFVSTKGAIAAIVLAVGLLILSYVLHRFMPEIVWGSVIVAALAVVPHAVVWLRALWRKQTDSPLPSKAKPDTIFPAPPVASTGNGAS